MLDLKFMAEYVEELLEYLEYDSTHQECYNKNFTEKYNRIFEGTRGNTSTNT